MKTLYLVGAIIVFLLILVLALPQFGATCVWYLINPNTMPPLVIFQAAGLGAVVGALITPLTMTSYRMGLPLAAKGLLAAFVGGITRAEGVILGGFIYGMIEAITA